MSRCGGVAALTPAGVGLVARVGFGVVFVVYCFFFWAFPPSHGGMDHTASPKPSPVEESGRGPPLGVKGSVSVSVSPSAR